MNQSALGVLVAVWGVAALAQAAALAPGDSLPPIQGEFLTGRKAALPDAASGKVALLLLGFTYDSRFSVEAWAKKFREGFSAEPRVTFFEIPMIGGMARMAKWFIDSGMRKGTPKADQEHVITVYGGADLWKQRVEFHDPKSAYLILIDPGGKVAWRHAGDVDEGAYRELSAEVAKLLAR